MAVAKEIPVSHPECVSKLGKAPSSGIMTSMITKSKSDFSIKVSAADTERAEANWKLPASRYLFNWPNL
jgi:hypothetical protein